MASIEQPKHVVPHRRINMLIAENIFGWQWIEVPKFDANGPLPEQDRALAPPDLSPTYEWPRIGIVQPHFFMGSGDMEFTTNPWSSVRLEDRLVSTGWHVSITRNPFGNPTRCHIWKFGQANGCSYEHQDRCVAVAITALLAHGIQWGLDD